MFKRIYFFKNFVKFVDNFITTSIWLKFSVGLSKDKEIIKDILFNMLEKLGLTDFD